MVFSDDVLQSGFRLKITLLGIRPQIWRRVETKDCTLTELHEIIQICMGWEGYHLWSFDTNGTEYQQGAGGASPGKTKLSQLWDAGISREVHYLYDFGDSWQHLIQIEQMFKPNARKKYPRCVKGKRACPPEDSGGPWGYEHMLKAIRNPRHIEHEETREWIGGKFDSETFDVEAVNEALGRLQTEAEAVGQNRSS
jgi:integrase/recombinase XerD